MLQIQVNPFSKPPKSNLRIDNKIQKIGINKQFLENKTVFRLNNNESIGYTNNNMGS